MNKLSRLAQSFGIGRVVCLCLLAALVASAHLGSRRRFKSLRARTFDFYQVLKPREAKLRPAVIVDIDEASLAAFGQWPWPRTLLADLVTKLTKLGSAAIAFDIIFAEPDRMSPAVAAQSFRNLDPQTRDQLQKLPSNDDVFADAIRRSSRVVLGEFGYFIWPCRRPVRDRQAPASPMIGPDPSPYLMTFPGLVRNIPVLEQAAAGRGMLTIRAEPDGIVAPRAYGDEGARHGHSCADTRNAACRHRRRGDHDQERCGRHPQRRYPRPRNADRSQRSAFDSFRPTTIQPVMSRSRTFWRTAYRSTGSTANWF